MRFNLKAGFARPHLFFCLSRRQYWLFVSLRPKTRDVATRVSGRKWVQSTELAGFSERVILQFLCVGCWAGATYLRYTMLTSPSKDETAVHCCDPTLIIGPCHVDVTKRFSYSTSLAVNCLCKLEHGGDLDSIGNTFEILKKCQTWLPEFWNVFYSQS